MESVHAPKQPLGIGGTGSTDFNTDVAAATVYVDFDRSLECFKHPVFSTAQSSLKGPTAYFLH